MLPSVVRRVTTATTKAYQQLLRNQSSLRMIQRPAVQENLRQMSTNHPSSAVGSFLLEQQPQQIRPFQNMRATFSTTTTAAIHPTYELVVNDDTTLVFMPCPGTKDADLETSLEQLKEQGVKAIVTTLTDEEMESKNVQNLGLMSEALGIRWFHLPIKDGSVPDQTFDASWKEASPALHEVMASTSGNNNNKVAIHCMGGSGRTGLAAARLLLEMGWDVPTIVEQVQKLRPGAFKKPEQIEYVKGVVALLNK